MNLQRTSITADYKLSLQDLKEFIAKTLVIDLNTCHIRISETRKYDDLAYGVDRGVFDGLEITITSKDTL